MYPLPLYGHVFNVILFLDICKCLNIIFCDIILDLLIKKKFQENVCFSVTNHCYTLDLPNIMFQSSYG